MAEPNPIAVVVAVAKLALAIFLSALALVGQSATGFPARWIVLALASVVILAGIALVSCEAGAGLHQTMASDGADPWEGGTSIDPDA